jgi:hypothetical protein
MRITRRMVFLAAVLLCTSVLGAEKIKVMVQLTVPDAAWTIVIDEVHRVKKELWVIATVSRDPDMMGAQVISTVQASVQVAAPDLPVQYLVIGKTWGWKNDEPYTFIKNLKQVEKELAAGKLLYRREKKKP